MYRGGITAYCTSITLAHVYVPEVSQLLKLLSQVGSFLSLHQQTPLHIAASKNYERTVECLVDEGADINIKDNTGVGVILYTPVASSPGPSQILSRSRGEKLGEVLGAKLRHGPEMVDSVSKNRVHVTY